MGQLSAHVRWHLKKGARRTVAAVASGCRAWDAPADRACACSRTTASATRSGIRSASARTTSSDRWRWLAEQRLAVSLADLEAFIAGRRALKDGAVLVTIDDGAPSVHTRAPSRSCGRHGIPAVLYVPAGELGADAAVRSRADANRRPPSATA
jgi:hypothetical protein